MTDYLNYEFNIPGPEFAATYDELPLWSAPFGLLLLEHVPLKPGMTVLDVGCGTGFPLVELAGRLGKTSRVYGIDRWKDALAQLDRKVKTRGLENVSMVEGNAAAMPFEPEFFDLVVSNLGLNNFENKEKVFAESHRVLKKGGTFALTTNLVGHLREFYEVFEKVLAETGSGALLPALKAHVEQRAAVGTTVKNLQDAGFKLTKTIHGEFSLRFADGSSFLRHPFIKLAFLDGWKEVVGVGHLAEIFTLLENRLNELSAARGDWKTTVPMVYLEAEK